MPGGIPCLPKADEPIRHAPGRCPSVNGSRGEERRRHMKIGRSVGRLDSRSMTGKRYMFAEWPGVGGGGCRVDAIRRYSALGSIPTHGLNPPRPVYPNPLVGDCGLSPYIHTNQPSASGPDAPGKTCDVAFFIRIRIDPAKEFSNPALLGRTFFSFFFRERTV